jgi:transposase InsO family protein
MGDSMKKQRRQAIRLPKGWKSRVRSAALNVISLAKYSLIVAQGWASEKASSRCNAECQRLQHEVLQLREELRIKDARMAHLPPHRRPHYPPAERMAILELRAARNWSLAQTARAFLVTQATISTWLRRLDEQGPQALVALREPVNKFPEFVHYLVCRLRILCPTMGKVKMVETLARAGLHLGATTVGRMLKEPPRGELAPKVAASERPVVRAKYANHVWHIDLTTIPTASGFWTTWMPFSFPQRWPFCWWVAVVVDHFSRRAMGSMTFTRQPTSIAMQSFLSVTIRRSNAEPKHLICDQGRQFWCAGFQRWCRRRDIRLRFGAVHQHGSIAVVERFILTLKQYFARLVLVPLQERAIRQELQCFTDWYNEFRPHTSLAGRTPKEVYHRRLSAARRPRYEPRRNWPRGSPCARPWALARNGPGARLELNVEFHSGRRHLPIVTLKCAA